MRTCVSSFSACHYIHKVTESDTASFINDFFVNVGNFTGVAKGTENRSKKHKKKKIGKVKSRHSKSDPHPPLWSLNNFTETEVLKVIQNIETGKSSGLEHISNKVLKPVLKILIEKITHILNLSVETCTVPNSWKKALVIPIPKSGDLSDVTNYRPISLLPQPGKVLEKLVHNRLTDYIENNFLLHNNQYGFWKNKSTIDALHQLTGQINCNMDKKYPTLVTFIDFKKAFDCVQHDLLIAKLKLLDPHTINWLENYLLDRRQSVLANNIISDPLPITQGVPQGSIIGPLLYILYANDIEVPMWYLLFFVELG